MSDHDGPQPGRAIVQGALAGTLATIAMSAVMFGFKRLGLMGEMPPEKITSRVLDRLGIPRTRETQDLLATGNHLAFGAAAGGVFGLLRSRVPGRIPTFPLGLLFASGIWAVSYVGWAPALGLMPPPGKDRPGRPQSMIAAHLVYGACLAMLLGGRRQGSNRNRQGSSRRQGREGAGSAPSTSKKSSSE